MSRAARYSYRHLSRSGLRAMLPAFVIAIGAMLIFTVQTLTAVVDAQAHLVVSDVGEEAVAAIVRASWLISVVSLMLGGFETAIIMSRSVFSRRREIGVLRAAGIGDRQIFSVFLIQSALYGLLGGAAGCVAGIAIVVAVGVVSPSVVDLAASAGGIPAATVVALALSSVIAILAGILPAYRATRMPAIEAIYAVW